jgi:hypothetical protein
VLRRGTNIKHKLKREKMGQDINNIKCSRSRRSAKCTDLASEFQRKKDAAINVKQTRLKFKRKMENKRNQRKLESTGFFYTLASKDY